MRDDVGCFLLLLPEEWIKKASVADVVAQFAMFEEDVHGFPERVIENLDELLVDERIVRRGIAEIGAVMRPAERRSSHDVGVPRPVLTTLPGRLRADRSP